MGCLTAPSHRSVRMKFVVILFFLLLGVVLGDPYRYRGHYGGCRGYGGYGGRYYSRGGYRGRGGHGYSYGKRDAEPEPRHGYGFRGGYGGYRGGYRGYRGRGYYHG